MTPEEREREKELKRLIYLRNEVIREAKKELKQYRQELDSLGNNKSGRRCNNEEGPRLVKRKQK